MCSFQALKSIQNAGECQMIHDFFEKFVSAEHPYCPKISAICVGGGASLALLQTIPGSSKFVSGIYLPYDTATVASEMESELGTDASVRYMEKAVQHRVALDLAEMARRRSPDGVGVGVTAALQTNRYRRGDNQAYIAFTESDYKMASVYHLMFPRLDEKAFEFAMAAGLAALRRNQDEVISQLILSIVYGFGNDLFEKLEASKMLTEI